MLAKFSHFRSLKVFVELHENASDFGVACKKDKGWGVDTPPFNEALGRSVVQDFFQGFFKHTPYSRLKELEVCFTRIERYDRGQTADIEFPIKVQRLERDDAPSPVDGGFTIDSPGKWIGGW